jgi:IS30 family transposase
MKETAQIEWRENNLSLQEIGDKLGVHPKTVSRWIKELHDGKPLSAQIKEMEIRQTKRIAQIAKRNLLKERK